MSRGYPLGTIAVALWLAAWHGAGAQGPACTAPEPVCAARAAVFAVSSFDPLASAVRVGPEFLVTNRHVVADETRAEVRLADGRRLAAEVVPTGYAGDLALLRVAGDLIAHGRVIRARSGLRVADLEPEMRARLVGARVLAVTPGGAAEQAGIEAGDVIVRVGTRPVRKASDVTSALQLYRPGQRVAVRVARGGAERSVELELPQ